MSEKDQVRLRWRSRFAANRSRRFESIGGAETIKRRSGGPGRSNLSGHYVIDFRAKVTRAENAPRRKTEAAGLTCKKISIVWHSSCGEFTHKINRNLPRRCHTAVYYGFPDDQSGAGGAVRRMGQRPDSRPSCPGEPAWDGGDRGSRPCMTL